MPAAEPFGMHHAGRFFCLALDETVTAETQLQDPGYACRSEPRRAGQVFAGAWMPERCPGFARACSKRGSFSCKQQQCRTLEDAALSHLTDALLIH